MLLLNALLVLVPLPLVIAQGYGDPPSGATTSSTTSPSPTNSAATGVQTIAVGKDGLAFTPNTLTAAAGTTVEFHFYPQTHSVAQSSFESPCAPINASAFFSGGFTVASGQSPNVWTLTINDTSPLWFYCAYPGHCEHGMAGVINPPSNASISIAAYLAAAANVSGTKAPAAVQGGLIGPPKAAVTSTSPPAATSNPAATTTKPNSGNDLKARSTWMGIFGAAVVSVGIVFMAA